MTPEKRSRIAPRPPTEVPGRTPAETETLIAELRHLRWTSTRIAAELDLATSTVCAVLRR